jgi:cardiolipin synthase
MIELLDQPGIADGAEPGFARILERIGQVEERLEIHMYVWRNDEIGNEIGRAVLAAAERGVQVLIIKDAGALLFERTEMNRKSFFPQDLPAMTRAKFSIVGRTLPDTLVEDDRDWQLGAAVLAHPNVTLRRVAHTHSKYYVFDEQVLITGSINIEDRHRGYRDYMVEIRGGGEVGRFRDRLSLEVPYDPSRPMDFLANTDRGFEIKAEFINLLGKVRERLYIEMAYIGDPDLSRAIVAASKRGVEVVILFSRAANIGNDINYHTLQQIWKDCELKVFLSDKMIHSKLMMFDEETVVMGSANLSLFSMQKAVELDVVVRDDPDFIATVRAAAERRLLKGAMVAQRGDLPPYNRPLAMLQQFHQKAFG